LNKPVLRDELMNLRRVTIQLDNELQITLKHLAPQKNNAIYKGLAPNITALLQSEEQEEA
jgi:hypothetical protein